MLDSEEQSFFGYGAMVLLGFVFLMWLQSSVTPPVKDHATLDTQVHFVKKHELKGVYIKYANRVYNEKYGK